MTAASWCVQTAIQHFTQLIAMALDKYLLHLHLQLQSHLQLQLQSQCPTQSSREDRFEVAT
jgi:hypothetical protein